jgi:BNR/Asp-box repeat
VTDMQRDRIAAAFERELARSPVPPGLRAQAIHSALHSRGAEERPRQSQAMALVATVLAIAIVATVLVVAHERQGVPVQKPQPHRTTPYTIPSPPSVASGCSSVPREWASQSPNLAKMLSATTGWAYGPMRTTDGGLHWIDVSPPSIPGRTNKNEEFFLDASHAWVAETATSSSACIDHVVIFRTADGGRTWQPQDDPPLPVWPTAPTDVLWTGSNNHAQLLNFIDARNGWLLLGSGPANTAQAGVSPSWTGAAWRSGSLWNTNDGGATWAVAPNPSAAVGCVPISFGLALVKATTSFSTPSDGWMLASCKGSANQADFLVTHDSGATWNRAATPLGPMEVPTFFDSKHGVATALGGLLVTSDGGRTWTAHNSPGSYGVDFINRNEGWAVGPGDKTLECPQPNDSACNGNFRLYYTRDGGVTWTPGARTSLTMMAPKWWPPAYLHFVDSTTGFVRVGEDSLEQGLYVTHDGGQAWTKVDATIQGP